MRDTLSLRLFATRLVEIDGELTRMCKRAPEIADDIANAPGLDHLSAAARALHNLADKIETAEARRDIERIRDEIAPGLPLASCTRDQLWRLRNEINALGGPDDSPLTRAVAAELAEIERHLARFEVERAL